MNPRCYSVLSWLVVAIMAIASFGGLSVKASAGNVKPDWINGIVTITKPTNNDSLNDNSYQHGNIPCELVSGYSWAWHSNGWTNSRIRISQNACVTMGESAYVGFRQVKPLGSEDWHQLDVSNYYHPWLLPNPGTNGLGLVTNSYADYANTPSEFYYTSDILSVFNDMSTDSAGSIVRSPSRSFEHKLIYPDGSPVRITGVGGISYSANGKWLFLNVSNVGQLRVSTNDMSVFSFSPSFTPQYRISTSISNSGDTVAVSAFGRGLLLYDLTRCGSEKPDYEPRNCPSRDYAELVKEEISKSLSDASKLGSMEIVEMKFTNESQLQLLVQYVYDGTNQRKTLSLKVDPGPQVTRYLALGDSFSSGEGVFNYSPNTNFYTNSNNRNLCHTSGWSYPEMVSVAAKPNVWVGSVACSGAKSGDITSAVADLRYINNFSQARAAITDDYKNTYVDEVKQKMLPGYIPESSMVSYYTPNVVTLTIGGNDIGFGSIIQECITQLGCYSSREEREAKADEIHQKIPQWTKVLAEIQDKMDWKHQRLYVVGYPKIVSDDNTNCSLIGQSERQYLNRLGDYLNEALHVAAARAGAYFIDMADVFYGTESGNIDRRICGDGPLVVNGLLPNFYADERMSVYAPRQLFASESYHPNLTGQAIMAVRILQKTNQLRQEPYLTKQPSTRVGDLFYENFVGDNDDLIHTVESLANSVTQFVVGASQFTTDIVTGATSQLSGLLELHSETIALGAATTDDNGVLSTTIKLPPNVPLGLHRLEFHYNQESVEHVAYRYIFIASDVNDYDGDGQPNNDEQCLYGGTLGVDWNKNGVDDACDAYVLEPTTISKQKSHVLQSNGLPTESLAVLANLSQSIQASSGASESKQTQVTTRQGDTKTLENISSQKPLKNETQISSENWLNIGVGVIVIMIMIMFTITILHHIYRHVKHGVTR